MTDSTHTISCDCATVHLSLELTGLNPQEQELAIIHALAPYGWGVVNERLCCPRCMESANKSLLPCFDHKRNCPKCGANRLKYRYVSGGGLAGSDTLYHGEHIEKTCDRCGYRWAESCDDAKKPSRAAVKPADSSPKENPACADFA